MADDTSKDKPPAAANGAGATGSHEGSVSIKAAEGSLMLGETAVYNSLKYAADEIARWINTSADLDKEANILMVEGNPMADSMHYMLLVSQLEAFDVDVAQQRIANGDLLDSKRVFPLVPIAMTLAAAKPMIELAASAIQAAPALLSAVNKAAGYFRADYEITSARTVASNDSLRAMVADHIDNDKAKVYFFSGAVIGDSASSDKPSGDKALLKRVGALYATAHNTLMTERREIAQHVLAPATADADAAAKHLAAANDSLEKATAQEAKDKDASMQATSEGKNPKPYDDDAVVQKQLMEQFSKDQTAAQNHLNAGMAKLLPAKAAMDATDALIKQIDDFLKHKEDEVMEV